MSKAILVIDMPDNCRTCFFAKGYWKEGHGTSYKCNIIDMDINDFKREFNCPLKPLPQRKYYSDGEDKRYIDGYDDCIDEILGEKEW